MTTSNNVERPQPSPCAFFSTQNPDSEHAMLHSDVRRLLYEFYMRNLPSLEDDFDLVCAECAVHTGLSAQKIERIFCALHRLFELPETKALQDATCVLDFDHLIAIDQVLDKLGVVPVEQLTAVDETLVRMCTPRLPNQHFPSPGQIRRRLRDVCKLIDPKVSFRNPEVEHRYRCHVDAKEASVEFFTTPQVGMSIDAHVRAAAQEHEVSIEEAYIQLLTGEINPVPNVVLHAYQATDVEDAPMFIQGYGYQDVSVQVVQTRDLTQECAPSTAYKAPTVMRKRVEGRDGTCRFPGCNKPAWNCQMDHRVNHADGGPTHPDNLVSLCQHHHNVKTDQRVRYVMDPITGDVVWLFADGSWVLTEATGPLSPAGKRWLQTLGQRIIANRKRAHANALIKEETPPQPLEDEAPPF